jgi:two-component system LytT family response regulator
MNKYKAYIVDDEISNLELIKHFLTKYCVNIEIIGESQSLGQSVKDLSILSPQILFLDIKLQDNTAFDILDNIDASEYEIIFVTAYHDYALKAFKYNAIDYILKPISIEELILAVNKAILRIEEKIVFDNQVIHNTINPTRNSPNIITISSLDKVDIIKKEDILFCKSDGRYTTFFLNNNTEIMACKNLGEFQELLKDDPFFRIHNSYIVNIKYVKNINKKTGYYCEMLNGTYLPIAKRRQDSFNLFLKTLKG